MAAVEQAAQAAQCPVCHELAAAAWRAVAAAVDAREPVNEVTVREAVEDACDSAPAAALERYAIRQVDMASGLASGAVWFVVRDRKGGAPPTAAERAAAARACQAVLSAALGQIAKAAHDAAKSYFKESAEVRG